MQLPKIQKQRLQMTKDVVPQGLRSLDYWQVMDYWKMFDLNSDGQLDRNEFYCLVNRMNPEPVSRDACEQMFICVDADNSGFIDCEEFLSWIFQMYAPYSGGLRDRLGDMDPGQVTEYFKRIDTNGNGQLDKSEFCAFVKKFLPDANLTAREMGDVFNVIDKDGSGEIDADEFIRWVYPGLAGNEYQSFGRRPRGPAGTFPRKDSSKHRGARSISPTKNRSVGLPAADRREEFMSDHKVVLEFTIGPDFKTTMLQIEKAFSKKLAGPVATKIIVDQTRTGCQRFVLRVGRGVMLWDKPTMMAYRDNPFETFESSRQFVMETIQDRMPALLRAKSLK